MKSLSASPALTTDEPGNVMSDMRATITGLMGRWGIGLGMLVGALVGLFLGWLLRNAVQNDQLEMIGLGLMVGVVAGFVLGLFIAFVDAMFLVRSIPAVVSGKTQATTAAALSSGAGVVAVFGLALLLLSFIWKGVLGEMVIMAPALCLAVVAWIAADWAGNRALKSALNALS